MRWTWRVRIGAGVLSAALVAAVCGPAAAGAAGTVRAANGAGPVVLVGTSGVGWQDVSAATPTLQRLLDQDSSGWLAVRSVRSVTCPVDGWLAVSAGRRAGDVEAGPDVGQHQLSCREPQISATGGGPTSVPRWSDYLREAAAGTFDAHPGTLGATLTAASVPTAAVGPGAAIALADPRGHLAHAWAGRVDDATGITDPRILIGDVRAALGTHPGVLVVDLGPVLDPTRQPPGEPALTGAYAHPRAAQVLSLDTRLGLVLDVLPANATVILASLADSGTPTQLQLLAARGPAPGGGPYTASLLGSASTRQDGLAQTTDLPATVLQALNVPIPDDVVGSALKPVHRDLSSRQRLRRLDDLVQASIAVHPIVPWVFNALVVSQILLYGTAALVLTRRRSGDDTGTATTSGRRRWLRSLRRAAVVFASVPAATFLANLLPWWRAGMPAVAVTGAVILFTVPIAVLGLAGPWRDAVLGPLGVIGALTALILGADASTGSHLILSSLMGVQPLVAGRFYGFSNPVFALFATDALLAAVAVADLLVTRRRPRQAVAAVLAIALAAVVVDGAPGLGSDFGGPPAIIPAFAVLALLVAGIRVTWRRALLIAAVTLGVLLALSVLDWVRPPGDRTHLGRFVQTVLDGGAWPVIQRKGAQNLRILFTSWLSALLPVAAAFVALVLARPIAWGARPLQLAYDRCPVLRHGLTAFAVLVLLATALNDSGTTVPAVAATLALPLLIASSVRALELHEDDPSRALRQPGRHLPAPATHPPAQTASSQPPNGARDTPETTTRT